MNGYVHSLESFGTVDGPGVRLVVFLQGCPMRCLYCHNPDTWETNTGKQMDSASIIDTFMRNRSFYKTGGITVSGGEPLLQLEFLIDLFTQAAKENIHTCLDTSGITFLPENEAYVKRINALLDVTDLVMLDIKHIDPEKHVKLTGHSNENILAFAQYIGNHHTKLWVRHVVVPGITDNENDLYRLGYFLGSLSALSAVDVLPYHTMGVNKYEQLGMTYPLTDTKALDKALLAAKKNSIMNGIHARRSL